MPLNYNKWDKLELSDDSDIEGHPNVDHKSLVRWKQRDIHEKRQARNNRIAALDAQIPANTVLLDRLAAFSTALSAASDPRAFFNSEVDRLRTQPSPDGPPDDVQPVLAPGQPAVTYDGMLLAVLQAVAADAKARNEEQNGGSDAALPAVLVEEVARHTGNVRAEIDKEAAERAELEQEKHKKITAEDMRDGWDSKYVPAKPAPPPVPGAEPKKKKTVTQIETLNAPAASSAPAPAAPAPSEEEDEYDALPEMTPALHAFSQLPIGNYEVSYKFIQAHRDVVVQGAWDALLVQAFTAQNDAAKLAGKARATRERYAKGCVHQSLLLQYCDKLGPDGVRLFFQKMMQGEKRALMVFVKDVEDTYNHLCERVRISQAEEEANPNRGKEQIQLVPENPTTTISFNVPEGPPPETIVLEGPGTEDMDLEEVRKALQMRWDVFESFSEEMKAALKGGKLEEVNKVLGEMEVEEAEQLVQMIDMAGILNFAEGGVRDETGKGKGKGKVEDVDEDENEEEVEEVE